MRRRRRVACEVEIDAGLLQQRPVEAVLDVNTCHRVLLLAALVTRLGSRLSLILTGLLVVQLLLGLAWQPTPLVRRHPRAYRACRLCCRRFQLPRSAWPS